MTKTKKLSLVAYVRGIRDVAVMTFRIAPSAVTIKGIGAVIDAVLPLVTTYFAAATTTELANAYNGDPSAGTRALTYVVITAGLGLLMVAWISIDSYIQALMRYKVNARVSDIMYTRFLSLDFWRYEDKDTADTYDKAQRFSQFYSYIFDQMANIFSAIFGVITAVIALWLVVPWVAGIVLVALIPGIVIQFKISRAQVNLWNKNLTARRAQNYIEWNLMQPRSIVELRLNGLVHYLLNLRARYRDQDERKRLDYEKQYIGKKIMADSLETAAELASLVWITLEIIKHAQPLGQFIYVQQIVSRAMSSTRSLVQTISTMDEDIAQMFDYQKFMAYPIGTTSQRTVDAAPHTITFEHVTFRYHGTKNDVLRDISLTFRAGQHIAIVGENGAGKSTLIKLLLGIYAPTKGRILIDGVPLDEYSVESWHTYLGILQQSFLEYDFTTIRENVTYGDVQSPYDDVRYERAIKDAEAASFIKKLKFADETYASKWMSDDDDDSERATSLSGGQWQRVALARSFYRDAPIVILDEPTSAIDALAESRIFKRLFADTTRTIIAISHRLTTVSRADCIYVLDDGYLVESGTHAELVKAKKSYYTLFESQLH